jgi:hypothetical protein
MCYRQRGERVPDIGCPRHSPRHRVCQEAALGVDSRLTRSWIVSGTPQPYSDENIAPSDRLDSWKEIAVYLKRDVRTVQRWEKTEKLPVPAISTKNKVRSTPSNRRSMPGVMTVNPRTTTKNLPTTVRQTSRPILTQLGRTPSRNLRNLSLGRFPGGSRQWSNVLW